MERSRIGGDYAGPAYRYASWVSNLRLLPRFGHGSDLTAALSPRRDEQADYAAGLTSLFACLLITFVFWTVVIATFKAMGQSNAGFLSGHRFVVPDPVDDDRNLRKRPCGRGGRGGLPGGDGMTFAFVFVSMGLKNVNNASVTVERSLDRTRELMENVEGIAKKLETVGAKSIEIRDAAVSELNDICPMDPNIADAGIDAIGITEQAKGDLTMLANFIGDGLEALNQNLAMVRAFVEAAAEGIKEVELWGWQMKLLAAGLFILPYFLAVGAGLVMLDLVIKLYQKSLTYFFMPLFMITIIACYVVCCAMLPVSAAAADACSGGGDVRAGPDDTVLTVYRNLRGDGAGLIFQFVGYFTQRWDPRHYPFDFLTTYMEQLDEAIESTEYAATALEDSQDLLEERCGRNFGDVLDIVGEMNENLVLLGGQALASLDLVRCENINQLYVSTVHEAGCTYLVDALAWIFASLLVVSMCGMVMITLRAASYPAEHLELGSLWGTGPSPSKGVPGLSGGASKDSAKSTFPDVGQRVGGDSAGTVGSAAPAATATSSESPHGCPPIHQGIGGQQQRV